jgi:hypothetical protein
MSSFKNVTINGKLVVDEPTSTRAAWNNGTILIYHGTNGGTSSIVFQSTVNPGSDMGYILFQDNRGSGGEANALTIGTSNDGDDDLYISASGRTYITGTYVYNQDWLRCNNQNTGIYWQNWGGGWWMQDSTYMRCYGDKRIYSGGGWRAASAVYANADTNNYYSHQRYTYETNRLMVFKDNDWLWPYWSWNAAGGASYFTSDRRLKKDIIPMNKTLDVEFIKSLKPVYFTWKDCGTKTSGFIAQDIMESIQKIAPEKIENYKNIISNYDKYLEEPIEEKKPTLGVSTDQLFSFELNALIQLIKEVEILEEENKYLK